jgi:ABC-type antimicrobial peptide transport system permease subunit
MMLSVLGALAPLMASVGIYAILAYAVSQRTKEIGIRMALGATMGQVQRGVMAKTLRLAVLGIAVGTAASFLMARGIAALLYGTAPTDGVTYAGMIVLLGAVALLAGYIPARRASRINPMQALRG